MSDDATATKELDIYAKPVYHNKNNLLIHDQDFAIQPFVQIVREVLTEGTNVISV